MRKIIIANWKMNPDSAERATKLAEESDIEGLVICPSFPFLKAAGKVIKKAKLGAQDLFWEEEGPYTGEVSGVQLKDIGVEYVIIGHSERRKLGETDEMAAKKIAAAVKTGLTPILCVGESREERASGKTQEVIGRELKIGLSKLKNLKTYKLINLIIAYEPIWAIGTGVPDNPENTVEMARIIKQILLASGHTLNPIIIYGGSVNSKNAESFLKHKEIGGALVGGASLDAEEIKKIVEISKKYA